MAISWVGSGEVLDFGTNIEYGAPYAAPVPFPATVSAGNIAILEVSSKPTYPGVSPSIVNTPAGWEVLGTAYGGGYGATEQTIGTGNVGYTLFYKVLTGAEGGTTVTVDVDDINSGLARIYVWSNATGAWNVSHIGGEIAASAGTTAVTHTFPTGFSTTTGDHILYGLTHSPDGYNFPDYSAESLTQSGTTFSASVEIGENPSASFNRIGSLVCRTDVTSGGGTTAPTMAFTMYAINSNLERGVTFAVRLRETVAGAVTSTIAATDTSLGVVAATTGSVIKGVRALLRDTDTALPVSNLTGLRVSIRSASNSAALLLAAVVDETTDGSGYIEISLEGVSVNINDYVYVTIEKSDLSIVNTYRLQVIGI